MNLKSEVLDSAEQFTQKKTPIAGEIENLLSDLLPYDPVVKTHNRLRDGIKEYILLLTALEQMVDHLKTHNWKSFDPLVGENACQIRAVRIAMIASKRGFDFESLLERTRASKKIFESALFE